jgi:hypothetical protein
VDDVGDGGIGAVGQHLTYLHHFFGSHFFVL